MSGAKRSGKRGESVLGLTSGLAAQESDRRRKGRRLPRKLVGEGAPATQGPRRRREKLQQGQARAMVGSGCVVWLWNGVAARADEAAAMAARRASNPTIRARFSAICRWDAFGEGAGIYIGGSEVTGQRRTLKAASASRSDSAAQRSPSRRRRIRPAGPTWRRHRGKRRLRRRLRLARESTARVAGPEQGRGPGREGIRADGPS